MKYLQRLARWYFGPPKIERRTDDEWQTMVDDLALAAAIGMDEEPRKWIIANNRLSPLAAYGARVVTDYYYAVVMAGHLDVTAIDGEMFALEAALAEEGR